MKKIFLHAGTHKTGTTALQNFACENPDILSRHGVYYPLSGTPADPDIRFGHHLLPWSLNGRVKRTSVWPNGERSHERIWGAVIDEITARPEPLVLLSSEAFSRLRPAHVRVIADMLSSFEVIPLLYFRRYDEYLQALYSTDVLFMNEKRTIADYIRAIPDPNYSEILQAWRASFANTLVIKPYYRSLFVANSIVCDILATMSVKIDPSLVNRYSRANAGYPWHIVECARIINRLRGKRLLLRKLRAFSERRYARVSYELLPPSTCKQMIADTCTFFEREFANWDDPALWSHLRGDELSTSDLDWQAAHGRPWSYLSRTSLDALTDLRSRAGRRLARVRVGAARSA